MDEKTKCAINRGMDKGVVHIYIYTVEYYSAIKNNEIMQPAATWMGPRDCHTE